jgi:cullin-4
MISRVYGHCTACYPSSTKSISCIPHGQITSRSFFNPPDINLFQTVGVEMVAHPERDEEMVPALLSFKSHLDAVLVKSFNSDDTFSAYLRESFELFINKRRDKPAEYIAKYLDNLLRKGDKGLSSGESSVESEMDRVLVLFRFVHGKDVFEAFYKKDLAKRLLLAKSASADAERSMLAKLKNGASPPLFHR